MSATPEPRPSYVVRRTSDTDYQLEDPDGTVLVSTTYQDRPDIPDGMVDELVTYAFDNSTSYDDGYMKELAKIQILGIRYVDDR